VDVVDAPEPIALTIGYLKPRILIGSKLVWLLSHDELEAVLRHELAHVAKRDPLRVVLADCVRLSLPIVPLAHHLAQEFRVQKELEADRAAMRAMGTEAPLASALLKSLSLIRSEPGGTASLGPTEARIDALVGRQSTSAGVTRLLGPALLSIAVLATASAGLFLLASSPGTAVLHICPV
jgi:Zn-dependent protease with chaperone function